MLGMQSPAFDPALAVHVKYHHLLLANIPTYAASEQASNHACWNDSAQCPVGTPGLYCLPDWCTAYCYVLLPCYKQSQFNSHCNHHRTVGRSACGGAFWPSGFEGGSAAHASRLPQDLDAWWHSCTSTSLSRHHCISKAQPIYIIIHHTRATTKLLCLCRQMHSIVPVQYSTSAVLQQQQ